MIPKRRSSRHSNHHLHGRKRKWIILAAVAYAVLLVAILVLPKVLSKDDRTHTDVPGNGAELFDTAIRYSSNGADYVYRQSDLTTLLLIGVDREGLNKGESLTARSNTQADFLLLLVLDRENKTLTPIQIDRDAIVPVNVYGVLGNLTGTREMQVCLAQGFGKTLDANCRNTSAAVSGMLLGIPIDHYMVYDLSAINVLNDLLGGVTVTVEDDLTELDSALSVGSTVTLHGEQAEIFVRSRMGIGDGTNVSRLRRQRAYMESALSIVTKKSSVDSSFIQGLIGGMEGYYASDMNRGYVVNLFNRAIGYDMRPIRVTDGEHGVGKDGFMECYLNEESIKRMVLEVCFEKQ